MLTKLLHFVIYVSQVITLPTFNLYSAVCQSNLNKTAVGGNHHHQEAPCSRHVTTIHGKWVVLQYVSIMTLNVICVLCTVSIARCGDPRKGHGVRGAHPSLQKGQQGFSLEVEIWRWNEQGRRRVMGRVSPAEGTVCEERGQGSAWCNLPIPSS